MLIKNIIIKSWSEDICESYTFLKISPKCVIMTSLLLLNDEIQGGFRFYINKRASLACAARLANTSCPHESPFGRLAT